MEVSSLFRSDGARTFAEFAPSVVSQLSEISNNSGKDLVVHVDVNTLNFVYAFAKIAA